MVELLSRSCHAYFYFALYTHTISFRFNLRVCMFYVQYTHVALGCACIGRVYYVYIEPTVVCFVVRMSRSLLVSVYVSVCMSGV